MAIENQSFETHGGVDFLALALAWTAWQNVSHLRVVSGTSVIPAGWLTWATPLWWI